MVLKLYFDFMSQPSRALYIFLKTCKIPFESHIVKISHFNNRSEEFEKINPFFKVPAIEHDGFKLIESVGIARYLSREYQVPDHWYPSSSKDQARVDEYLEYQHLNTRLHCSRLFLALVAFPMMRQREPNPKRIKECEENMIQCLDTFESKWLGDQSFLMGSQISLADLFAACEIEQIRLYGYNPRNRPKLARWFERVAREATPHYTEAHEYLEGAIRRIGAKPPHTCDITYVFP